MSDCNDLPRRLFILACLASAWLPAAAGDALSLEELVTLKNVSSARLNPAGDRVAYLLEVPRELYVDDDGPAYSELHVVDLDGRSTAFVSGRETVSQFAWSADGESLYFLAQRDPEASVNSLWRIALDGGEARKVFTHENSINAIFPGPDGRRLAFTAPEAPPAKQEELAEKGFMAVVYEESVQRAFVWMLDLQAGTAERQELPGHAADVAWAADGERYAVALAPTPLIDDHYTSRDIHVVDAATAEVTARMGSVGKLGHFAFSPDGERIAYIGSVDIHDPAAGRLYVASTAGGERRDLVANYGGHVSDFAWRDAMTIDWLGDRGVWTEWLEASIAGDREAAPAPSSGPILRALHSRPGLPLAVAVADTPAHPGEVYLLRRGEPPRRLTRSNPLLGERRLARQEAIRVTARDGLELDAVLIHPFDRMPGGNPLVIFVHGGPESRDANGWESGYSQPGQVMAAAGYAVVYPNYRGSTGRGVEFSKLGQHDYAEKEFNDLVDVKRHLVEAGIADGDRTGISGGSYGGYATMWAATALTGEFAAAVAFVGISNQTSKFGTGDIPVEMYRVHSRAWPWEDWMWMLQRSPVFHAGNARTPLLIMGGDKDPRVHPSQSLEMYRHVRLRTDTPVRLVVYPGEVHGNRHTAARYDYALRLKRWMDHYLMGPGGDLPPREIDHAARLPGD